MRHYREVMGSIHERWTDGYMGVGNARSSFGRGVILILVVGPDETVRDLLTMEGRSVFAKFRRLDEFEGCRVGSIREDEVFTALRGRRQALEQAIHQVEKAKLRQEEAKAALQGQPA